MLCKSVLGNHCELKSVVQEINTKQNMISTDGYPVCFFLYLVELKEAEKPVLAITDTM